jgi:hypothetical protein
MQKKAGLGSGIRLFNGPSDELKPAVFGFKQ